MLQKIKNRTTEHVETCNYTFQRKTRKTENVENENESSEIKKIKTETCWKRVSHFRKQKKQND